MKNILKLFHIKNPTAKRLMTSYAYGEMSSRRNILTAKSPHGKMSLRQNFFTATLQMAKWTWAKSPAIN